jgi:tetratricopeptide (TPR) repeat protein
MSDELRKPPILDLIVELGIVRLPMLVGESPDTIYRPQMCLFCDHASGRILQNDLSERDDTESSLIVRSLDKMGQRLNGFPKQILTRSPQISRVFKEPFQQLGIEVVVRESLPMVDEAIASLGTTTMFGNKREPSLMHVPGITLDHLIAFAEAGKLFYDAKPWHHLWDDDLIEIESPAGPGGTRFAQVLGAMGQTMGFGFVPTRQAHEDLQAGHGLARGKGHWNLLYMALDEMAYDDGQAWEQHNLPAATDAAGDLTYPRFGRFTASSGLKYPKPEELIWAEGLLRAIAASTEAEFDSGRWEKQVVTFSGPVTYRFSMPILLEQIAGASSKSSVALQEPPQVMMERMLRGMRQEVEKLGRTPTPKDLKEISRRINSGKLNPTFTPKTPQERAQDICYQAKSARGRRIVQLAKQALEIDPDCCDALWILADRLSADQSKMPLLTKAAEAAERQLGPEFFKANAGHFWGVIETRPYMRAMADLALEYLENDQAEQSIKILKKLLELNPGDNQGNRYMLAEAFLAANRLDELDELLNKSPYHGECSPEWEYTRTLLMYRRCGDTPPARIQLAKAISQNPLVAQILTRGLPEDPYGSDFLPPEIQEAADVAESISTSWEEAEGALEWLKSATSKPTTKPKKKRR